jgi:putative hemolysin
MEIFLLVALILFNGAFAMSEIALVTARRSRLLESGQQDGTGAWESHANNHEH